MPNSPPPLEPEEPPPLGDEPLPELEDPEDEGGDEVEGGVTGWPDSAPNSPPVTFGDSFALDGELETGSALGALAFEPVWSSPDPPAF
jgi:hypothetical protein